MTIAITTPTGHVGSHVVRMLVQAGVRPRLLLRNPDRLDAGLRDRVELAVGDQRDADYVAEATRGVEAIFWVHPDDWSLPDPDADAERTGEGLAAAMRQNRIARVVFQSSIGAELRHGAGFIDGLARIELRLDAARDETGAALLHLRCGYFMTNLLHDLDGLRAGRLMTTRPLDAPMPWVDPSDIATVATLRLLADDWTGRQVQAVHGPTDLTWHEAAATLSAVTGVSIQAQQITEAEERSALRDAGLSDVAVDGIIGMAAGEREGFVPEQPRSVLTTTPSSLAGWAITHLRPALSLPGAQLVEPGPEQRLAVRVAVQPQVALAEAVEQRVVEPAYGARRVAVAHPLVEARCRPTVSRLGELVERGDAELEQQPRDPGVVVGARPAGVGVLAGQEGGELLGADPRVVAVGLGRWSGMPGLQPVADRENSRSASSSRPAARVNRRSRSGTCSSGIVPL